MGADAVFQGSTSGVGSMRNSVARVSNSVNSGAGPSGRESGLCDL